MLTADFKEIEIDAFTVEGTVNDKKCTIKRLPADPAWDLGIELFSILLAPFGSAIDGKMNFAELFPEDRNVFTQMALYLKTSLSDVDRKRILHTLLNEATLDGKVIDLEKDPIKFGELLLIVEFAMKVNFADFFPIWCSARGLDFSEMIQEIQTLIPTQDKGTTQEQSQPD